jgi:hypothetical protein
MSKIPTPLPLPSAPPFRPEGADRSVERGRYERIGMSIGCLVDKKQAAYGRSFDKAGIVLRQLYPEGIRPEQYDDLLAIVRILDKFFRIATDKRAFGENPWGDVAGYSLLMNGRQNPARGTETSGNGLTTRTYQDEEGEP